jgi:hypothetical protein
MATGETGTSSVRKSVAVGVAAGLATAAAAEITKRLRGRDGSTPGPATTATATKGAAAPEHDGRGSAASRRSGHTKQELYHEAKRLEIAGRSKMTKAQLERAIQRARR